MKKENLEKKIFNKKERQKLKINKQEIASIKAMRKNLIKSRKESFEKEFDKKIIKEKDEEKQRKLLEEYKRQKKLVFKEGFQKNSNNNIIELSNVNKYYITGEKYEHVLKDINLKIKSGTITVILGTSGSGKSTLLNILSGLIEANNGDVVVADHNLMYLNETRKTKFRSENISFVFQSYNLIPTLTVKENINVGYNLKNKSEKNYVNVDEILDILDLKEQANKYPYQLSGGQNQRISIGRALAKNPKILFADEPTGALDEEKGKEALQLILDINKKFKTTIIMVTHNNNFVKVGNQTIIIKNGEIIKQEENKKQLNAFEIRW